jgi:hypothetical protein
MSKFSLLIMGGAMGLFCVSSEAVLAKTVPPNIPNANINEARPPFAIPKGGNFNYRGTSPFGEVLVMNVAWKISQYQPKTDTIRISGDVKYKNAKTGMIDSLVIDENKSYITKAGELRFALHAFSGKVFGPVDLVALDGARLAKSGKPIQDATTEPGSSRKPFPPAEDKKPALNSDTSNKLAASSMAKIDRELGEVPAGVSSLALTASKKAAAPVGIAINDVFQTQGEFSPANQRLVVKWKQANFIRGLKYPPQSKAISYDIYLDGKKQSGWKLTGPAYLDKDGFAYVPVVSPQDIRHNYKSKISFHSENFKTLVKAVNQIKKENKKIKEKGLKSLGSAIRDKKGQVIATDGTIILYALVRSIKAHNVAHKKSALATRTFDNINRLLQMDGMGWIVHRMVKHAGLKVNDHKRHGRSLVEGECSSSSKFECSASSNVGQYSDHMSLIAAAPTPFADMVDQIALDRLCENGITNSDINKLVVAINNFTGSKRDAYAKSLADFLTKQRHVGRGYKDYLQNVIEALLIHTRELRAGRIDEEEFHYRVRLVTQFIDKGSNPGGMTGANIVNLILQMPGFEINNNLLATAMRSRVILRMNENLSLYELRRVHALPSGVVDLIRELAHLFVFRVAGKCDLN